MNAVTAEVLESDEFAEKLVAKLSVVERFAEPEAPGADRGASAPAGPPTPERLTAAAVSFF